MALFIDVREPFEFASGHVKGAINLPPAKIVSGNVPELNDVPRDTEIVVYCRSGSRSNATIPYLRAMGFHNITNGINKDQVSARYRP